MSVTGIENEYGISVAGLSGEVVDPQELSAAVVRAGGAVPTVDLAATTVWGSEPWGVERRLTNGARFYVDHAHPEYSGPEVTSARDAVIWDSAGDMIVQAAAEAASAQLGQRVQVHKNTCDGKGHSYGCHENYLVPRSVPFDDIVAGLTAQLVSRVVFAGAGRVGIGQRGERVDFQIGQRPDFFEARVGLETTVNRALINTRDEPHADSSRWRRLHLITGDALIGQWATWVKVGAVSLVLQAISAGVRLPALVDPVSAFRAFSHDPSLTVAVACTDGRQRTAVQLQREFWQRCPPATQPWLSDAAQVHQAWGDLVNDAEADPMLISDRIDWAAKYRLLTGLMRRGQLGWDHPKLAALDLQWADLNPSHGIGLTLQRQGSLRQLVADDEIERACTNPPSTTRAWLRGQVISRFGDHVVDADWSEFTLLVGRRLVTVRLPEPLDHGEIEWAAVWSQVQTVDDLIALLRRRGARVEGS